VDNVETVQKNVDSNLDILYEALQPTYRYICTDTTTSLTESSQRNRFFDGMYIAYSKDFWTN